MPVNEKDEVIELESTSRRFSIYALYNLPDNLGSLSSSRNRLKYSIDFGLETVLLGLTSLPLMVCLTAASIFLPFMVVGMPFSGTSMMNRGT